MAIEEIKTGKTIKETVAICGLDCPDCALKVEKAIKKMPGVEEAAVNFAAANLHIEYNPEIADQKSIFSRVEDFGYKIGANEAVRKTVFRVKNLDCPDCSAKLEKKISGLVGVEFAELIFQTGKLTVEHQEEITPISQIVKAVEDSGYSVELEGARRVQPSKQSFWFTDVRALTVIASSIPFAIGAILQLLLGQGVASAAFLLIAVLIAGYRPAKSSVSSIRSRIFDMNVLMSVAVIGAIILGEWLEAAAVMFLFSLGTMLEAYTMDKTRNAIHKLMEIAPSEATVKLNDSVRVVPVEDVRIADVVVIKPGERIPVDGEVVFGRSSVNQSAVTGESLPATKEVGSLVFAGTLNHEGYLEVKATKLSSNTTIAHIIKLIEDAQAKKAPSQQFIDKFSAYYTPVVIASALAVMAIPPLFGEPFLTWFYRALVLLVISCPCALVISTPVSIASAIGAASRNGVLIKGGAHLETIGRISAVVFDKTGTLTTGQLSVTDVVPLNGFDDDDVLRITASIEARSAHPLAKAVVGVARDKRLELVEPHNFESLPGRGLKAEIGGVTYYAGNPRLFSELGLVDSEVELLVYALQKEGKTVFILGTYEKLIGIVAVADSVRRDARGTIKQLHELGINNVIMLTGDNADTAKEISGQLGVDSYRAELLPEDKVDEIDKIAKQYGRVAMVGDGVNDAPAITRADVGIAMGAVGSDIALETSDVALMADELRNIPYTVALSRRTIKIIKQNVAASIIVKIAFIALAVGGLATLWMAVFADTGISILVILNGMRLFSRRPYKALAA